VTLIVTSRARRRGVRIARARRLRGTGQPSDEDGERREREVDDAGRRTVEVVGPLGDELADLVDEQPESDAAQHRRTALSGPAEERQGGGGPGSIRRFPETTRSDP
jgi:hypothetical protein